MQQCTRNNIISSIMNYLPIDQIQLDIFAPYYQTHIKLRDSVEKIRNLDDYLNNMMLQTALTVNQNNPQISIAKLAQMQQAKVALNSTMKFIDASK